MTRLDSTATFSDCGLYRYTLSRRWLTGEGTCLWLLLNPSTATATEDDPTIRRCIGYSKRWGYSGLVVCNLFAFRATDPAVMKAAADPVGPENDDAIILQASTCDRVVCGWGEHGSHLGRDKAVLGLLDTIPLWTLRVTKGGHPNHPVRLPYSLELVRYDHA